MKSILFFGDSIMAGRGLEKSKTYVSLLTQKIQSKIPDRIICYDLAVPGETAATLLERLETECHSRIKQKQHESIIVINGGINDIKSTDDDRGDFKKISNGLRKNIEKLITQSLAYSAKVIFIGLAPLDENLAVLNSFHVSNRTIQIVNQEIRFICDKYGVKFIDVFSLLSNTETRSHLDDGIHLNKFAHRAIYEILLRNITLSVNSCFNQKLYLKKITPNFSDKDFDAIVKTLLTPGQTFLSTGLIIGKQKNDFPEIIIGAPCIRKDTETISFNTFYQIFMPMAIAKKLKIPCALFIGVKEEILLRPNKEKQFSVLAGQIASMAAALADILKVKIQIIRTDDVQNDKTIEDVVDKLNICIGVKESTYLFNLAKKRTKKTLHSKLRAHVNERVLACDTATGVSAILGVKKFMITEDLEQLPCFLKAERIDRTENANFLGFVPCPSLNCAMTMFKAEKENRLLIGADKKAYERIYDELPDESLDIFMETLRIYNLLTGKKEIPVGKDYFADTLTEISEKLMNKKAPF